MWRFGVAMALLIALVGLVANMLFEGKAPSEDRIRAGHELAFPLSGGVADGQARAIDGGGSEKDGSWLTEVRQSLAREPLRPPADATALSEAMLARLPEGGPFAGDLRGSAGLDTAGSRSANGYTAAGGPPAEASGPRQRAIPPSLKPIQAPSDKVALVQKRLAALGYDVGSADGRMGRRTEAAVRQFQKDGRMGVDGRLDDRLLARLDAEVQSKTQLRQQELEAMAPGPAPKAEKHERGVLGSVLGGFQRLLGRNFNSVRRPHELAEYCQTSPATWIYDFGREAFLYCSNVNADQGAAVASSVP